MDCGYCGKRIRKGESTCRSCGCYVMGHGYDYGATAVHGTGHSRGGLGWLVGILGVALIITALAVGLIFAVNGGVPGRAITGEPVATPEQTVERLLEAAARGDVKALAELLDPEFLKKMGITKEAFVKMLGQYPVDSGMKNVQFRDMKFKVEYGKDGTANVSPVSGEVIYTDENGKVHTEKVTEEDTKQPLKLVKRDGTWYVSIDDEILSGLEELIDDPKPERVEVPDNGDWAGPTTDGKVN